MTDLRPRRSVLYMPAANARALEKAKDIAADALIFDLEDAVAPDAKEVAREQAAAAVASGEYGNRELTIRCNGLDTPWGADDITAAAAVGPSAIVVPKVTGTDHLAEIAGALEVADAPDHTSIWAMVETPEAIFAARDIAAFERVAVMVMGTNDLAKEMRAEQVAGRHSLVPYLAQSLLAARAEGTVILDGVYNDIKNEEGFLAECRQGFEMGFDGKTLIHPKTLEAANRAFGPTEQDIDWSRRVVEVHAKAEAEGAGVVLLDGQLIENLHVEEARRVLALAEMIEALAVESSN